MEKSQYDELKAQQNIHWWFTGKREIVIDFAEVHAGLTPKANCNILDVGCGMGLMLDSLAHYGNVYGVDTEEDAVEYCKLRTGGGGETWFTSLQHTFSG